ncbi:hypothetical protein BD413DRAFT_245721 [Trametes elegans]|nr:hypothetical protein BD413DRAFT_245721 [Trametes elegans]
MHGLPDPEAGGAALGCDAPREAAELMLTPPVLYGFSLADQKWMVLDVEHVNESAAVQGSSNLGPGHVVVSAPPAHSAMDPLNAGRSHELPHVVKASTETPKVDEINEGRSGPCDTNTVDATFDERLASALALSREEALADTKRIVQESITVLSSSLEDSYVRRLSDLGVKCLDEFTVHKQILVRFSMGVHHS